MEDFEQKIKRFLHAQPFRPFIVELQNGSKVTIEHPEAVLVRYDTAVYIAPDKEFSIFDADAVTRIVRPPVSIRI